MLEEKLRKEKVVSTSDIQSLSNEELVKEFGKFKSWAGIESTCDPFWWDPRPDKWDQVLQLLEEEVLRRLSMTAMNNSCSSHRSGS